MEVLCILTNLVPPPVHFQGLSLQLFPINKALCPEINPDEDILYYVYIRSNKNDPKRIKINDDKLLSESGIDFDKPTVVFFHGFMERYLADDAQIIKNNYLEEKDVNVILADMERLLAGPFYITSVINTEIIGKYSGKFIDYLVSKGLRLSNLHIIGMSLGGQISGITGSSISSGKAARITGLDPAGPFFNFLSNDKRIDRTDGEFVDIIHTNAGLFGYDKPCGHVDFWINGGAIQPGCKFDQIASRDLFNLPLYVFCHHYRSYQVFGESIRDGKKFPAIRCGTYRDFKQGRCNGNETAYIGEYTNTNLRGNYYGQTPAKASYIM